MTELERELRGLAAAIAFPETPEIAANVRLDATTGAAAPLAAIVAHRRRRRRRSCSPLPSRPAWPCRRPGRRSCTGSGSARCGSSSSTACPRSGPTRRSTSAPRSTPADAPFPLLRPDRARRARRHLSRGRRRHAAVRHPGAGARSRHGDRGLRLHARRRQEARRGRDAGRVRRRSAGRRGRRSGSRASRTSVLLPGGPARLAANTLIWTRGPADASGSRAPRPCSRHGRSRRASAERRAGTVSRAAV